MESLRQEEYNNSIKTSIVFPGVVDTNLFFTVGNEDVKNFLTSDRDEKNSILYPEDIFRYVVFMMDQPDNVDINDILVSPTGLDV